MSENSAAETMTERETLQVAKDRVEITMGVLEDYDGDSYAADEASNLLGRALNALSEGLDNVDALRADRKPTWWDTMMEPQSWNDTDEEMIDD